MQNDFQEKEFNLGIDVEYNDILSEIGREISPIFQQQAEKAARLFTMMDNGVETLETKELLETISGASFVGTFRARKPELFKTSFPQWVIEARENKKMTGALPISGEVVRSYEKWVLENNGTERIDKDGTYIDHYNPNIENKIGSSISSFKAYIPNNIDGVGLIRIFEKLKERGVHPDITKLSTSSNRLVFYWTTPPTETMISELVELGITEVGQDSFKIVDDQGKTKVKTIVSRDRSLGKGQSVVDFGQEKFDKAKFFKNYLQQCLFWWRDPSDPRWMSYVPSDIDLADVPDGLKQDASEMNLEIVHNPARSIN